MQVHQNAPIGMGCLSPAPRVAGIGKISDTPDGDTIMEWTITLDEENRYVEIVTGGLADRNGSLEMAKEITRVLAPTKIKKILIDHRNIRAVSGDTVEIYQRPKEFKAIGAPTGIKVAEVVKAEHKAFFRFLETVCVNRGFFFLTFEDRESALKWLLASDGSVCGTRIEEYKKNGE
jgi:hypothetical protein